MTEELDRKIKVFKMIQSSKAILFNLKKNVICNRNKNYSKQLASEYYRSLLMKNYFRKFKIYYLDYIDSKRLLKE